MTKDYYKPNEITFKRNEIIWLIPYLPLLRSGTYPSEPSTGYTDTPIGHRQVKARAGFENPAIIAAELDWRLQQVGVDGLFLELAYSQPDDRMQTEQHIAEALKVDINRIDRDIERALRYVCGFRRKKRTYNEHYKHQRTK